jgi:hypothetical protein
LLCWLGALNLNWPGHPPVLVYDAGLAGRTVALLARHGVAVRKVPPFCPHWSEHGTWRLWCLVDAPARDLLWMDAGLIALAPLEEVYRGLRERPYYLIDNGELLEWEASEAACRGCGVSPEFRRGRPALSSAILGVRKTERIRRLLGEALAAALVEEHIAATAVTHRREQALLSLLLHKHLDPVVTVDGTPYLASSSPDQLARQKCWPHRGALPAEDVAYLAAHVSVGGEPYRPRSRFSPAHASAMAHLYRAYWYFGHGDFETAAARLIAVFEADPAVAEDPRGIAHLVRKYDRRIRALGSELTPESSFILWTLATIDRALGSGTAHRLRNALALEPLRL